MGNEDKLRDYLKRATADLRVARQRLTEAENRGFEPLAVIGMSCRYPGGVESPEDLWQLVAAGGDAISEFPTNRGWDVDHLYHPDPDHTGTAYSRHGGFLHEADEFDAEHFGISPREAAAMDPQQRLLLEAAWTAFESAGMDPTSTQGSAVGVFTGVIAQRYPEHLGDAPGGLEGYLMTGTTASVASGRLAYTFGLAGPAVTIDTACSSSLVAVHLAAQALRAGECSLALAGGVTVMASPDALIGFSRQRGLAPDGRCKAFAADADGTGFAEGVGLLVLERLSDAQRNGHTVLGVIRGSAVNQDGASNGLTAPNGPAQQRVIQQALANARLTGGQVDAVEAHGTGTSLGDPIEAQALLATYGQDRPAEQPLWLGSIKSNIGHTQAAAGVAGIIKMIMAMRHQTLPRTLHVGRPSPHVDWSGGAVELLTEARDWPDNGRPRRAGISSFGISGTNAHVIVEQPQSPEIEPRERAWDGPGAWVVSGSSEAAVRAQAARLREVVGVDTDPVDLGFSLASTRAALAHRAVVIAGEPDGFAAGLDAIARGAASASVVRGTVTAGKTAFLFTGQGSQRLGMGRELYERYPVFRESFDQTCATFDAIRGGSLRELVFGAGDADAERLDRTEWAQPALFAVEVALFRLVESFGLRPDVLAGHSIGEVVAAHLAGVLSLADAGTLVAARSRLMQSAPAGGAMVSVQASRDEIEREPADFADRVAVAGVNGPAATVLAGDAEPVLRIAEEWRARGRKVKRLRVSHAFHSPHMDGVLDEFRAELATVSFQPPLVPVISNVTGEIAGPELCAPEYWVRHVRAGVLFLDGIRRLRAEGVTRFLELGPDGTLTALAQDCVSDDGPAPVSAAVLRPGQPEARTLLTALARMSTQGAEVDWTAQFAGQDARRIPLPAYAFQRSSYWLTTTPTATTGVPAAEDAEFWAAVDRQDASALAAAVRAEPELASSWSAVLPGLAAWRRSRQESSIVDGWRYRVAWRPERERSARLSGTWLVLTPAGQEHPQLVRGLAERGAEVRPVPVAADTDRASLAESLRAEPEVDGIVSLLALDEARVPEHPALTTGVALTLLAVQALGDAGLSTPLWLLTRGAVSTGRSDPLTAVEQAAVWGLGRVVSLECPGRWGGLADLPAVLDERALDRLAAVLAEPGDEDQLAIRDPGVYRRRLVRAPADRRAADQEWRSPDTVLITGGTGALGARVARWLAGRGAGQLVLVSRRGPDAPGAAALAEQLSALGARVSIAACDVTDRDAVAALVDRVGPVQAVVHAAGLGPYTPIADLTSAELAETFDAKVTGAGVLDEVFPDGLSAFVLFSSVAGTWGGAGQGGYAAANAALDALAQRRRARGAAATSLAWGPWAGAGMAEGIAEDQLRGLGLSTLDTELALTVLGQALAADETFLAVAEVDWARFAPVYASARPRPLLAELAEAQPAEAPAESGLARELAELPAAERGPRLLALVRDQAAAVLGHADRDAVAADRAFRDLGFDSLTAVELRTALSAATGLALPATLVFDYPTPAALAEHLRESLLDNDSAVTGEAGVVAVDEPVAIIGMACRYPGGVSTPEQLWQLVADGVDAIGEFPADRGWDLDRLYHPDPEHPGTSYVREGGFLREADRFDPAFFGISPREALATDPQQRLLLETAWEAIEQAGINPHTLRGTDTGVFAGVIYDDYAGRLRQAPEGLEGYLGTGSAGSVASGRVAYTFGLEGPAISVDTACSSSLVALHLAARALRARECSLALAGGVTVMATPAPFVEFSRQRGLAPDGRCKAFAAGADGTDWGEGVGLLLIERLSDARRHGHPVLAVLRGSAVNQDGASNGLTAPNGPAQQRVIQQALSSARLTPAEVDVVEAHGTGTALGDPIEAQALLATYGRDRPAERPLWLGSIKSNIGHTQAAAGVAGVIKMIMAMRHQTLPRTLHVDAPSPHVEWSAGAVELLTEAREWPRTGQPRRAGISSFGISGTNAHVIIEAPDAVAEAVAPDVVGPDIVGPQPEAPPSGPLPWVLSAATPTALRNQAAQLRAALPLPVADVAHTLARRAEFAERAVIVADSPADFATGLDALAAGTPTAGLVRGRAGEPGRLAFLFTGQGSQRAGMGGELAERFPVFRESFDEVCAHLDPLLDKPLRAVIDGDAELLDQTGYTQAALFAVETALYRLVTSAGLVPDFLIGHSIGELVAAHVSGVLSLPDACALVAARGRLMQAAPDGGAMVSVRADVGTVAPLLAGRTDRVSLAAVNGPEAVVLSGDRDGLTEIVAALAQRGIRTRWLRVSHAFHSAHMDGALAEFTELAGKIDYHAPAIPVISNVTGALATAEQLASPEYWAGHIRGTVRFADGVATLDSLGVRGYLELGPDAVLGGLVESCLPESAPMIAPVLRRDRSEAHTLLGALATAHTHGQSVRWPAVCPPGELAQLPGYPFDRQRYWLAADPAADLRSSGMNSAGHPLLAAAVDLADGAGLVLTGRVTADTAPWLAGRPVTGALLEIALHAADRLGRGAVTELELREPLLVPARGGIDLQVVAGPCDDDGRQPITVHARPTGATERPWTCHASGLLGDHSAKPVGLAEWPPADAEPIDVAELTDRLADAGLAVEAVTLRAAWRGDGVGYAELALADEPTGAGYAIHPLLLDAAIWPLATDSALLASAWREVSVSAAAATVVRVRLDSTGDGVALQVADETGAPVATAGQVTTREYQPEAAAGELDRLYELDWREVPVEPGAAIGSWAVLGEPVAELPGVPGYPDLATLRSAEPDTVFLPCLATGSDPVTATHELTTRVLELLRNLLADNGSTRLVVLTRGATPVTAARPDPAGAAVCGFTRSVQTEYPDRITLLDLSAEPDPATTAPVLAGALASAEPQLAIHGATLHAPRLTAATGASARSLDPDGTVLITGGTGTLGALVARHLATAHGIRRLLLVSRSGPEAAGARQLAADLGPDTRIVAADLAEPGALADVLAEVPAEHPLTAIVHTAGILADAVLDALRPEQLTAALRPKVDAAWQLHQQAKDLDLAAFVLFSSAAGLLGSPGQAGYAAANSFLDALAQRRAADGQAATSVAWGLWAGGMAGTLERADLARISRTGVVPLTAEQGLAAFDAALGLGRPLLAAIGLNVRTLRGRPAIPAVLRDLAGGPARRAARQAPAQSLAQRLAGLSVAEQSALLVRVVCGEVAGVLGHAGADAVDPDRAFTELGFDSLTAVELRNQVNTLAGLRLSSTLVFDHPTPRALAEHLRAELAPAAPSPAESVLAGLDALEAELAVVEVDDTLRPRITSRLQTVLAKWNQLRAGADPAAAGQIRDASTEEIFDFIDRELGRSVQ